MAASGSSYKEMHMKIHKLQHNLTINVFWIPSLKLFWAIHFARVSTYTPRSTYWTEVSKVNWEKLEKDEDTQHHEAYVDFKSMCDT